MFSSRLFNLLGYKAIYLNHCRRLKKNPRPVSLPIFGKIKTYHEIINIHDNFAVGQLRDDVVETYLSQEKNPVVVDCGVNIGITVRWWLNGLGNNNLRVIGIDMINEAHKFTINSLLDANIDPERYQYHVAALWEHGDATFNIDVEDPLLGETNVFDVSEGIDLRVVHSKKLDDLLVGASLKKIDLLKLDIEGAGAHALEGGLEILKVTKHVVIELHDEEEQKKSSKLLLNNGFYLRKSVGRHLWWERV
jgi:FkbM family methyltransferase